MLKHGVTLALAMVLVGAASTALADPPEFEPYGAWRGRIRYVDGPFGTRTRIRWGNGITPIGGQVLMHGFDVAGSILTNPDVLKLLAGLRGEEEAKRGETAESKQAQQNIETIKTTNENLRTQLNDVRKLVGLTEPVVFKTPVASAQPAQGGDAPAKPSVPFIPEPKPVVANPGLHPAAREAREQKGNEIKKQVGILLKAAEALVAMNPTDEKLKAMQAYAKGVEMIFGSEVPTENAMLDRMQFDAQFRTLTSNIQEFQQLARKELELKTDVLLTSLPRDMKDNLEKQRTELETKVRDSLKLQIPQ